MNRNLVIAVYIIIMFICLAGCGKQWTEDMAKAEAFRGIQQQMDLSSYPSKDPNFAENQDALSKGVKRVGDRFITANPPSSSIAYVVSRMLENGLPASTSFYDSDGHLFSVRIFSSENYPRSAHIYCAASDCSDLEITYKKGDLLSVAFHLSQREVFYFKPTGELSGHIKD